LPLRSAANTTGPFEFVLIFDSNPSKLRRSIIRAENIDSPPRKNSGPVPGTKNPKETRMTRKERGSGFRVKNQELRTGNRKLKSHHRDTLTRMKAEG